MVLVMVEVSLKSVVKEQGLKKILSPLAEVEMALLDFDHYEARFLNSAVYSLLDQQFLDFQELHYQVWTLQV